MFQYELYPCERKEKLIKAWFSSRTGIENTSRKVRKDLIAFFCQGEKMDS